MIESQSCEPCQSIESMPRRQKSLISFFDFPVTFSKDQLTLSSNPLAHVTLALLKVVEPASGRGQSHFLAAFHHSAPLF